MSLSLAIEAAQWFGGNLWNAIDKARYIFLIINPYENMFQDSKSVPRWISEVSFEFESTKLNHVQMLCNI